MKKIKKLIISAVILVPSVVFAQGPADALRYSENFYEGTARTLSMGNAFTALGGDLGSITINPAGSGIYRYSEMSITPSFISSFGSVNYLGYNHTEESNTRFALSNLACVTTYDTGNYNGILNYNIGLVINRTSSFNSVMRAMGTTNNSSWLASKAAGISGIKVNDLKANNAYSSGIPWSALLAWDTYLISPLPDSDQDYISSTENIDGKNIYIGGNLQQDFFRKTTGGVSQMAINAGVNISDRLYLGANLNLHNLYFRHQESYSEKSENSTLFQDGFGYFKHEYTQTTKGTGASIQVGLILIPFENLRMGASFTSPVWYSMKDQWSEYMESAFNNGKRYNKESPLGEYDYRITTPLRFNVGLAYTIGNIGLISADYERVDYSTIKMSNDSGNKSAFSSENRYISSNYKASDILRFGAEVRVSNMLSLRGGYNLYSTAGDNYPDYKFISGGVGLKLGRTGKTFLDIAYQRLLTTEETFSLYNDYADISSPRGTNRSNISKLLFTLGVRF